MSDTPSLIPLFDGVLADVGVLVDRNPRGRGYSSLVAAAATTHAVRSHQIARRRSLATNTPSRRTASRLECQDDCIQRAIRPGRDLPRDSR